MNGSAAAARNGSGKARDEYLVADLGATYLRIAVEEGGSVRSLDVRRTAELEHHPVDGIAPAVVRALEESWRTIGRASRPAGVGIGVAAYVSHDGTILQPRPFGLAGGTALRDGLAAAFECPVAVDNDANVAALGELTYGAGRGIDDFLLVTLGTNIGLGIVSDGRVIRGAHGAAGEAGNLLVPVARGTQGYAPVARSGRYGTGLTEAPRGYAWLEDLVGGAALARSLEAGPGRGAVDGHVFVRAAAGDRQARVIVRRAIEGWSMLFAQLVALFDPACIVLSGGLVEDLLTYIEPLRRRAAELSLLPPDIRIGELGAQAGLVGAAVAVRTKSPASGMSKREAGARTRTSHTGPDQRPVITRR